MRTEKIACRVEPKVAAELRKLARRQKHETLSTWLRALLEAALVRDRAERKGAA